MRFVTAADIDRVLTPADLVAALREAFRSDVVVPVRHHHPIARGGEPEAMLLLMPAWTDTAGEVADGAVIGVKIVTVVPGNAARSVARVIGSYLLMDGVTGAPLSLMDGTALTLWRTAAASALAASHLARPDAARLVMIGAGALAPHMIRAHAAVRPIREVTIWNRDPAKAAALAAGTDWGGLKVTATTDLEAAVRAADVVSAATMSKAPLVLGDWLAPGTHVDLVGAYTPAMRESDDTAILRASVFVDTRAGATREGGDIVQPLQAGLIGGDHVRADLFGLCRGEAEGRTRADEITLFKSVGTAIEDLAAARLVEARLLAGR